jgi:hypothetical protein
MANWKLTNEDLYLLVKMLGGKVLIGVSNPFPHYGEDELEKEWERMFKKLHGMELVDYMDGELKFDDSFIGAMWVLARSKLVSEVMTDEEEQSIFYFSDEMVVECMKENETNYSIYTHPAPEWTMKQVIFPRMLMGIENRTVRMNDCLYLLPRDYYQYVKEQDVFNLEQVRMNNELGEDSLLIKHFRRSVQRKIHSNRLMVFYRSESEWAIEGVHVLSSPSYNWTLRMINKDGIEWLHARQATGEVLVKEITGAFERVKVKQQVH